MKRAYIGAVSLILAGLWSCTKDEGNEGAETTPAAPTEITVSPESLSAPYGGGALSLTVTSPVRPRLSEDADWVSISDGTFKDYRITFTVNVSAFGEYDSRETVLTVTAGQLSKTVTLTQTGREKPEMPDVDIATAPVTSGATAEAVNLYRFLLENYGKKTVSSIMANVNWNNDEAEKVYKAVGKYPAMNCYDFIHILYSGANWINYSDLTPVTTWHDAGGIVSLMWHFNVPKYEGAGTENVTCTPSETSFRASNALKEGTWEHTWFYDQMDKVAEVILALQQKGIAAIWRPFHEAAGNYYALKWNGAAWFWWGYEGPEVYKQIWNALQDYFYDKGIRNLIWVWTAQDYNGDPSSYDSDAPFYPGDDRVDVVARDIYGGSVEVNLADFLSVQRGYPHKMVTLGECGKNGSVSYAAIPDVWNAGAKWSWFMVWYGANMEDSAWWKAALESDDVLTRDEINI